MITDCPCQIVFSGELLEILDFAASCPGELCTLPVAAWLICWLSVSLCLLPFSIETSSPLPTSLHHAASAFPAAYLACLP